MVSGVLGASPRSLFFILDLSTDLAQFLSGANLGCGVAWVDVLCNDTFNFSVCGNINGNTAFPVVQQPDNWDFMVIAHEMVHNFGASHTHSYCPPLDECASNCNGTTQCTNQGTIMSYCHLCPGGTSNITTYFHPAISTIITGEAAGCLPLFVGMVGWDDTLLHCMARIKTGGYRGCPSGSVPGSRRPCRRPP